MKTLAEKLLQMFLAYGYFGAGLPSVHGGFEAVVPKALRETQNQ